VRANTFTGAVVEIKGRHIAGLTGALALAGTLITYFESPGGMPVLHTYPDPASGGAPWTYCDGETQHPQFGHAYTVAECDTETSVRVRATDAAVLACTRLDLPNNARAAFDSLAWNIGNGAFCNSSAAGWAKLGNLEVACQVMTRFNRAGGAVMPGLVFRRDQESKVCALDATGIWKTSHPYVAPATPIPDPLHGVY